MSGLSSRKSEPDFEKIDAESGAEDLGVEKERRSAAKRSVSSGGSWMPWSWGAGATTKEPEKDDDTVMGGTERDVGKSSGVDA